MKTQFTQFILPFFVLLFFLPIYNCKHSQNEQKITTLQTLQSQSIRKTDNLQENKKSLKTAPENELAVLSEKSRKILLAQCGSCHQKSLKTSNPKALAIFDLDEKIWYKTMSQKQLEKLDGRIQSSTKVAETDKETIKKLVASLTVFKEE